MKRARKKRVVRRKRRISEREVMRIKRKLKKSARKLRLGAKRTGAYVYGTLRRIVGNPAIPANMSNPEYVSAYRRAQRMAKSGRPIGIYAFRSGGVWRFGVGEYGATRLPGDELVSIFNAPGGLRGNPSVTMQDIQRIVGKINSEGGNARVVPAGSGGLNLYLDRISPYDGKTIERGHEYFLRGTKKDIYEALIKIRFVPMYHPYARKLQGNPGMVRPDSWARLKILTPAQALREFKPLRKSISDESEPLLFFRTPTAESPKTIASLARKIGHYNDFNGRKVATVIERIGRMYPKVSIVLGREYSPALWLDNVYEDFAPGFMANAKKFLKTSEESYDPLRRRIRLWWD